MKWPWTKFKDDIITGTAAAVSRVGWAKALSKDQKRLEKVERYISSIKFRNLEIKPSEVQQLQRLYDALNDRLMLNYRYPVTAKRVSYLLEKFNDLLLLENEFEDQETHGND